MNNFNWGAYKTDKYTKHGYDVAYDKHFFNIRNDVKNVLEIGTRAGSAILWTDYFPNANVYGIDWYAFDDSDIDRYKLFNVDVYDKKALLDVVNEVGTFDIIIDDGPHKSDSQLIAFSTLMEYINIGGYYVIEDLHCTSQITQPSELNQEVMSGDSEITMNDYMRDFKNGIYKNYKYINNSNEISKLNLEIFDESGTKIASPQDGQIAPSEIIFVKRDK